MAITMATPRLANGGQRPDVICPQLKTGVGLHDAAHRLAKRDADPIP